MRKGKGWTEDPRGTIDERQTYPDRRPDVCHLSHRCLEPRKCMSFAEVALSDTAEATTLSSVPLISGLDTLLSRSPSVIRTTAGLVIRIADIENSLIDSADDESLKLNRQLPRHTMGHKAAMLQPIRQIVPGATIVETSFMDGEMDVVRHARETRVETVIVAFHEPARVKKEEPPSGKFRFRFDGEPRFTDHSVREVVELLHLCPIHPKTTRHCIPYEHRQRSCLNDRGLHAPLMMTVKRSERRR